jgi:hypothetical protein
MPEVVQFSPANASVGLDFPKVDLPPPPAQPGYDLMYVGVTGLALDGLLKTDVQ